MISHRTLIRVSMFILVASASHAQQRQGTNTWGPWRFLLGEWIGGGSGEPGKGAGSFTFSLDLQDQIIVRKSHTEYPASKDRPAFSHDDFMVVYQEPQKPTRAIYFDNEGHVIHYSVEFSADSTSVIFLSDPGPSTPQFRLTYVKREQGSLGITFDVASPDRPQKFSRYIEGIAQRRK